MDYPIKTLAQLRPLLQGFRKRAGYTQAALASRLGITQQSYAQIEANPAATSVERLFTIFRLLDAELVLASRQDSAPEQNPPPEAGQLPVSTSSRHRPAPPRVRPPSGQNEDW